MTAEQGQDLGTTEKGQLESKSTREATVRVIPADVYDALELSAYAYGGIGAGAYNDRHGAPLCMLGHKWQVLVTNEDVVEWLALGKAVVEPIKASESDAAVRRINARYGWHANGRVPFAEWCEELHAVRGES